MAIPTLNDLIREVARDAAAEGVREALGIEQVSNRRLMSVAQAAEYLDAAPEIVRQMLHDGELPLIQHGARTKIDKRDLDAWIERKKRERRHAGTHYPPAPKAPPPPPGVRK